jgi:hypothetical protein
MLGEMVQPKFGPAPKCTPIAAGGNRRDVGFALFPLPLTRQLLGWNGVPHAPLCQIIARIGIRHF